MSRQERSVGEWIEEARKLLRSFEWEHREQDFRIRNGRNPDDPLCFCIRCNMARQFIEDTEGMDL